MDISSYVIVIQDGRVMPDCFCRAKYTIEDGSLSVWRLTSEGIVTTLCEGIVFNGKFHEEGEYMGNG